MSPDLEHLIQLQQIDTAIADAQGAIARHPQRLADADARLNAVRALVDDARQRMKDNQEARRALEKDAAVYQSRLSKFKDQLSAVKTNREYQAMQKEIEVAQGELGTAEEKVLERMVEADALTAEVARAEATLTAEQKLIDAEKARLVQELSDTEAALRQSTDARAALIKQLDARLLSLYEQVARVRKGVAICMATRDGLCSVCHVRLRPQVFQLVRQNSSVMQCDSCQRILYYVPPPPPVEAAIVRSS